MNHGNAFLNHQGRFSRNKAVSAMHPGYILGNTIPVVSWNRRCSSEIVIILHTYESLYTLAPKKGLPLASSTGFFAPSFRTLAIIQDRQKVDNTSSIGVGDSCDRSNDTAARVLGLLHVV